MNARADIPAASLREQSYLGRRARLLEATAQAGADGLIAYGCGAHSFIACNPAWYVSGFKQMGPHLAAVAPLAAEPFLVVTPKWDLDRAMERSTIADVVACEPDEFLAVLASELQARGLSAARFAVAGGGLQARPVREAWTGMFRQTPIDADRLVSDIARIRDAWSLACTHQGVQIAEAAYDWLLQRARPGQWEHQLVGELEAHIRDLGAEDNFQLMSASQHNRLVHMPTRRLLADGDILLSEITPAVDGEFVQICRTAVFGKASALLQEKFALLDEALHAGMKTATPGTAVDRVVEAINAPIAAAGYERYTKPPFMRTRGHSMALGSMDPEIAFNTGQVLEKGMVFVMHPNQYIPETGYLMCGEPVIVTDEGARPLTQRMGRLLVID